MKEALRPSDGARASCPPYHLAAKYPPLAKAGKMPALQFSSSELRGSFLVPITALPLQEN
jgi:hypothetical protein